MFNPNFVAHQIGIKVCSYMRYNNIAPIYALNNIKCDTINFNQGERGSHSVTGHVNSKGYDVSVNIVSNYNRPGLITAEVYDNGQLATSVQFENANVSAYTTSSTKWFEHVNA